MIPNHLLILGSPNSGKLRIAKIIAADYEDKHDLTTQQSHSGIIIKTSVLTKYYQMKLTIMVDEFSDKSHDKDDSYKLSELTKWYEDFQSEEYEELREVIDGIIFTVNMVSDSVDYVNSAMDILSNIRQCLDEDDDWNGFICVVGSVPGNEPVNDDLVEQIEDGAIIAGFEFVNLQTDGVNEYKEKQGRSRIKELIECHEWSNMAMLPEEADRYEKRKLNKLDSMTVGLLDEYEDENEDTPELAEIFNKLSLYKDIISNLPPEKRQAYADKALEEIIHLI
ncbi:Increased recombination centers protein 6 [Spathaspora sp. JA1]|nr:Increased recombination centers protein 6 [Spathaspora sp. JA1]